MTLVAEYVRVNHTGTGTTGPFAVPFRFEANAHIKVARRATSGTVTILTEGADYTLTGGPESGQVVLSTALAAASGAVPAEVIEIYRERPLSQNTALGLNNSYRSTVIEAALDEGRQIDQDLDAKISRALRAPPTENVSMVLPSKQSRAGALLGFNAVGEPIPIDPDTLDAMGDGDPLGVTPVNAGGTGATTAAEARTNLGIGAVGTLASIGASDIATAHAATSHATIISADLIANNATRLRDLGIWIVESATVTTAPAVTNGLAYLVPLDATETWASQTGKIAYGEGGVWTYKTAVKGWNATAKDTDIKWYYDGSTWVPTAGTGGGTVSSALSTQDARVAGIATVNSQGGSAKFRVHWTVDQRIVVFGDQAAFGYDPAGDNWQRFELAIPWDVTTVSIEAIYAGLNYILVQTNQSTGNLWQWDATAKALVRVQKFIDDAVRIADVVTEANLGNTETFWFARTTANTGYGWGYSGAQHVMGYGSTTNLTTPRKLTYSDGTTPVTNIASFSVSTAYAPIWCRLSTGVALRWGAGTDGAHGNNNTTAIQWPTALETAVGSGISRTDIAQIAVTGSNIVTARAVTWLLTTAGKIEASGSRYHGNGDGSALTSAASNTFQAASGAIASLTATAIVAGGGEAPIAIALLSTGNAMMCGYQSGVPLLGGGVTTNLTVFTALTGLPSGFSGAITAARICGGDGTGNTQAAYLQATISGVKTLASIGYDTVYATGKNTGSTSAGSQVWGLVLGGRGTISSWQAVGSNTVYGIEVLNSDGELRYAGGNDQGQGGVQVGNLHSIPILQPCMSGPRMVKPPTWRGAYSAGTSYTERDVTELGGSAWVNVVACTGVSPPTLPTTSNANWQLLAAAQAGVPGADGLMLRSGAGAPSNATGANGEFYIDTTNSRLYGPKAAGVWPGTYVSLVGLTGNTGPQGGPGAGVTYVPIYPHGFVTATVDSDGYVIEGREITAGPADITPAPISACYAQGGNIMVDAGAGGVAAVPLAGNWPGAPTYNVLSTGITKDGVALVTLDRALYGATSTWAVSAAGLAPVDDKTIFLMAAGGQSLSTGTMGHSPVTYPPIGSNLITVAMPGLGGDARGGRYGDWVSGVSTLVDASQIGGFSDMAPEILTKNSGGVITRVFGETLLERFCLNVSDYWAGISKKRVPIMPFTFGFGGTTIENLSKTGAANVPGFSKTVYANNLEILQRIVTLATAQGKRVVMPVFFWKHSNANTSTAQSVYQAALTQLISDWTADVKAITGQQSNPIVIAIPDGCITSDGGPGRAMVALHNAGTLHLAAADYPILGRNGFAPDALLGTADYAHMNGTGYAIQGEWGARAFLGPFSRNVRSPVLLPSSVTRVSSTVFDVTFAGNTGTLVLNTSAIGWTDPGNYGANYVDSGGGGSLPAISSVTVQAANKLRFTMSADYTVRTSPLIRFGENYGGSPGFSPTKNCRTMISDSSAIVSGVDGVTSPLFCIPNALSI